jgi:hypothetical protein
VWMVRGQTLNCHSFSCHSCAITCDYTVACSSCTTSIYLHHVDLSVHIIFLFFYASTPSRFMVHGPLHHITDTSHRRRSSSLPSTTVPTPTPCGSQGQVGEFQAPDRRPGQLGVARWAKWCRIRPPIGPQSVGGVVDLLSSSCSGDVAVVKRWILSWVVHPWVPLAQIYGQGFRWATLVH